MNWTPPTVIAGHIVYANNKFQFHTIDSSTGKHYPGAELSDTVYEWRIGNEKFYVGETDQTVRARHSVGGQHIRSLNKDMKRQRLALKILKSNGKAEQFDVYSYDMDGIEVEFFGVTVTPREALERALCIKYDPPLNRK